MLRARHDVSAYVRWVLDIAQAERVGQTEGLAPFPHLQNRRDVENARTCVRRNAAIEQTLRAHGQRIELAPISEGELIGGISMIRLLAPGAHRLSEAHVQRHQSAADVRKGPVKDTRARLVLIEAEMQEAPDHPAAL